MAKNGEKKSPLQTYFEECNLTLADNRYTLREKKFDGTAKEVALLQVVAHHPRIQKSDFFRFQVARGRGQSN